MSSIIIRFQVLCIICLLMLTLSYLIQGKMPYTKKQQEVWRLECELGMIADPDCPVDGSWAPWGPWSPCKGPCDETGHRRRTRRCDNPPPSKDGLPCNGPEEEIETCYLTNCSVEYYRKLVEGDYARSQAFQLLETVPSLMERCLQMQCPFEAIEVALSSDNTWQLDPEALWNSLLCVKHNLGCPVTGEWGAWGAWSACGARCGLGYRWRLRRCDRPPPSAAVLVCSGTPLQAEECEGDQCALDVRDVSQHANAKWNAWGQWSQCSESCGYGVKRRRRSCNERVVSRAVGTWGTHCAGPHDQFEVCESSECILHGGWSGWSAWGPCSQTCGAGRRSRTRSCTRPIPSGGGLPCVGPKTEIGSCYLNPCDINSHEIAILNGESLLQFNFENKHSTLFHFFVRFMALSPHGTLVRRRGASPHPLARLSLQKWHICLDASGLTQSCAVPRICTPFTVEPAVWHTALVAITNAAATLRIDDARVPITNTFPCDPDLSDQKMNIVVGERMHGAIQELSLNFIPLDIVLERENRDKRFAFCPSSATNIVYEKANKEEAYLILENDQYLRLPCFSQEDEWRLELTLKSKRDTGTLLFLRDDSTNTWLHMGLQNMRLILKMTSGDYKSESSSSTECPPDQWLDITVTQKRDTNAIKASINGGEHLHVVLDDDSKTDPKRQDNSESKTFHRHINRLKENSCEHDSFKKRSKRYTLPLALCNDEFFVGGIPCEMQHLSDLITPFSGIVAAISINNALQDLHDFSVERCKNREVQVSSRTASISGSYHETSWGNSNRLNLTCLHARTTRSPHTAQWLYLDSGINKVIRDKTVRSVDDGRVLRLVATASNDLRGFYTCRAHTNKRTRNIVTYGVLGKIKYRLSSPDMTTALAVITTLSLIIGTLAWLVIEGIYDLRNGSGFYRDVNLSPEEEAEAVCSYIEENKHLIGSESDVELAKARARRKCRKLRSRANFGAQEPQGLMKQIKEDMTFCDTSSSTEPEGLPALPEVKSSAIEPSHDVFRCDPCYTSSPRHGSNLTSPRAKWTTSSSLETSPRVLCSRLLLAKRIHSSKESIKLKRNKFSIISAHFDSPRVMKSNLLAIKSSSCVQTSPAHKILDKFKKLKNDDD